MSEITRFSITMPEGLKDAIDAVAGGNRSDFISRKLMEVMESEGLYSISNKAKLIAAIQGTGSDISEEQADQIISILAKFKREEVSERVSG